jgi:hypothetical protein
MFSTEWEALHSTFLKRSQAAATLTAWGFPTKTATLATKAVRGGGPPYFHYSGLTLYDETALRLWALSVTSNSACTTTEHALNKKARKAAIDQVSTKETDGQ